ncbi:hypothetical protein H257_12416 [Aphanomyces astaci]|uniref:Uncharacterized protein n=1 Tax=Aphanomyces astaci TaxID=112090 RepID=W4G062_APHAT|nr:hypothetical protein H257_12416 [Aphanomyces astaci]ETV72671.1 hypothetical protein H257_12416 [Aphanomyces astaci]|eukprot:XP_009837899.1 hypothetical protein H257_12416 [Aphanomyces astaci]
MPTPHDQFNGGAHGVNYLWRRRQDRPHHDCGQLGHTRNKLQCRVCRCLDTHAHPATSHANTHDRPRCRQSTHCRHAMRSSPIEYASKPSRTPHTLPPSSAKTPPNAACVLAEREAAFDGGIQRAFFVQLGLSEIPRHTQHVLVMEASKRRRWGERQQGSGPVHI